MAFGPKPKPVKERLLSNMAINPETNCWLWLGACNNKGYGKIGIAGKTVTTHRASYTEFKGEVPEGKMLRHTCDNRKCFNPGHDLQHHGRRGEGPQAAAQHS